MDANTADAIYTWIAQHPKHTINYGFDFSKETPVQIVNRFVANPQNLNEYSFPLNSKMSGPPTHDRGCDYIFKRGPDANSYCRMATFGGSNKCSFHNHLIFKFL